MKIMLGADPEFFLTRLFRGKHFFYSAHELVPGTKKKPYPLKHGAVQLDGTAVEFNINPANTPEEFASNIESVLKQIREMVPKEYSFSFTPTATYTPATFRRIPEYCKELGCEPDYSAYTSKPNPRPNPIGTMRTGAGHLHVGWGMGLDPFDRTHKYDCEAVTKAMDGVHFPLSQLWDKDRKRMKMYGARGAYRPKPYGVEYRVLSNAWLNYPDLWPFLFEVTQKVMDCLQDNGHTYALYSGGVYRYLAPDLLGQYKLEIPECIRPVGEKNLGQGIPQL